MATTHDLGMISLGPCLSCGDPVAPSPRVLYQITGFRRHRSAGGTNHVIAEHETGGVVCDGCAERVQRTGEIESQPQQDSLL